MDQWSIESLKDRARKKALTVLAIVAAVVAFCGLAYGVFRLLSPDYLDEYDDYDEDAEDSEE